MCIKCQTSKEGGKKFQIVPKGNKMNFKITMKSGISFLQAVTMIHPATGWIEIFTVPSARADLVFNQVELACLTYYPLPSKVVVDMRNEFLADLRKMIINDHGIKIKPITSRNL